MTLDVISYNTAILSCDKGRQWELVLSLINEMQDMGVTLEVISFNKAISACEYGSRRQHDILLLGEFCSLFCKSPFFGLLRRGAASPI